MKLEPAAEKLTKMSKGNKLYNTEFILKHRKKEKINILFLPQEYNTFQKYLQKKTKSSLKHT